MTDPRRVRRAALAVAFGAAAAVALPGAAHADEQATDEQATEEQTTEEQATGDLSRASPLDLVLSTPGDVIGTLADGSPI
ncbi:hypothetical protein [Actinomycetospora aeridis]|uniref:Uncharacterized protein n=1 Tax=Actinomycetospora aeridis TaxID=3129231 RepID=A0ABU8NC55_9PSEU